MCGIAGLATADGLRDGDETLVDRMLAVLGHRGPDEQRTTSDSHAIIGARRLSIIDLETGGQPISNENGAIHVTQNGEIYNYLEIREELRALGHRFRTQGDTETIAHLYEQYGDDFVDHLRGMFAIAIWDAPRRRLLLARDRLGKKPLYWRLDGGRLAYGSELKSILCDASWERTIDRVALARYLQYQYIPAPQTIFTGVQKLAPASMLVWEGGPPTIRRYWELPYEPKPGHTPDAQREECISLLREAVRLRLRSDVPLGLFLSSGVDSSTVLAFMAEAASQPVTTFTVGFSEAGYDERAAARAIAQRFGTNHVEEVVQLDAVSLLPELALHYDEPFGDSSAIPTFRVAQVAARHVRVVLTGDGGDESFGGYGSYLAQRKLDRLASLPPVVRGGLVRARRLARRDETTSPAVTSFDDLMGMSSDERYVRLMSMSNLRLRSRLMANDPVADQDQYLLSIMQSSGSRGLDRLLATDTASYLPDDLMVKMDRATMACSLEARAPLLDHQVVQFAAQLPASRKVDRGTTKVILREVAQTLIPARHLDRPKHGFSVPLDAWFRGRLGDIYRDTVLAPDALLRDHLDQAPAGDIFHEHIRGVADHGRRLWLLLSFEAWARQWLTNQVEAVA